MVGSGGGDRLLCMLVDHGHDERERIVRYLRRAAARVGKRLEASADTQMNATWMSWMALYGEVFHALEALDVHLDREEEERLRGVDLRKLVGPKP